MMNMKTNSRAFKILAAATAVLVVTTVVLLLTIGPWKKSTASGKELRSGRNKETTVSLEDGSDPSEEGVTEPKVPEITFGESVVRTSPDEKEESGGLISEGSSETTEPTTEETSQETSGTTEETTSETTKETTKETTEATTEATTEEAEPKETKSHSDGSYDLSGMVIVIDPGHQRHANSDTEDLAPWSDEQKAKVSGGTTGVSTGRPEYEVVLEIALKMRDYLEDQGATVILTRSSNDVDISNVERARIAVDNQADVFLRLHCDASDSSSARGIGVFVCSRGELSDYQVKWGDWLGTCLSEATGAKYRGCDASTRYSGLNWATSVPSFLLEMGFMSNATDDELLSDPDYQHDLCVGVAAFCQKMKNR